MSSATPPSKVAIVGAGICGLAAAVLLARAQPHIEIELWEASTQTGGLLAPIPFCGVDCDRGSHRIHPQADPLLRSLTQQQHWQERPRRGTLVLNRQHIHYPPQPIGFLRGLGAITSLQMALGFALRPQSFRRFLSWEQDRAESPDTDEGFAQFVLERVGDAAYQQFYRPYVEKVWGLPPSELSRTVAKQRVSTSSPWQTLLGMLKGRTARQNHQHFLYPRDGMTGLVHALRDQALALGVALRSNHRICHPSLHTSDANCISPDDLDADAIFFSGQLSDLAPGHGLDHRGLYLLHVAVPRGSVGDTDTFYTPEADYWFGRVSQLEKFSPSLRTPDKAILCVEIPEGRWGKDKLWTTHLEELQTQLITAGIVAPQTKILDSLQTYIPRVYPMYTRRWFVRWREALAEIQAQGRVFPIGRQGLFLHCNVDHCVRIAGDAVDHFSAGRDATSWIAQVHRYLDLRVRD